MDYSQLTLVELLDDPMTIAVMTADHVDAVALKATLSALSRRLGVPPVTEPSRIGRGWYPQPCDHWPPSSVMPSRPPKPPVNPPLP